MLSGSDLKPLPEGENLLESCNNEYWRSTAGGGGKEAEIIIDLKCPMWLESFLIMNGFGDFGTKQFSLSGSVNLTGPWTDLYRGELTQGVEMTEEVKFMIFTRDYNFLCRILSVVSVLK